MEKVVSAVCGGSEGLPMQGARGGDGCLICFPGPQSGSCVSQWASVLGLLTLQKGGQWAGACPASQWGSRTG